jgi:hypothetical protein
MSFDRQEVLWLFVAFALSVYLVAWLTSRLNQPLETNDDEAALMLAIETKINQCLVCQHHEHTWGEVSSKSNRVTFAGLITNKSREVVTRRCDHCGHLTSFARVGHNGQNQRRGQRL